jgi:hypothetical protein
MSTSSINNLSSSYLQSLLGSALQNTGLTANSTGNGLNINASSTGIPSDNSQLSPFAQLLSTLQQLQQTNPTQYTQVTQQIATNLQTAAQTAQTDGNTTAATQLNQLATDFTSASKTGQLPNIQDLAQAVGGGHHRHHHAHAASGDSDSDSGDSATGSSSSSSSSSSGSASQSLSQLLASFQSSGNPNDSLNPLAIILNTLSSSGINVPNS